MKRSSLPGCDCAAGAAARCADAWSGQITKPPRSRLRLPTPIMATMAIGPAAKPADAADRGAWWAIYQDAELNDLEQRCASANQNIAAALHAYEQAHDLVRENRASLYPDGLHRRVGHAQPHLQHHAAEGAGLSARLLGVPDSAEHLVGAGLLGRQFAGRSSPARPARRHRPRTSPTRA